MECIIKFQEEIKDLCLEGLTTDGAHHKQWYLEEILRKLGYNTIILQATLALDGNKWEPGIPP